MGKNSMIQILIDEYGMQQKFVTNGNTALVNEKWFWHTAPEGFDPETQVCGIINGDLQILDDAGIQWLHIDKECTEEISRYLTFETTQEFLQSKWTDTPDALLSESIRKAAIEKLKQDKEAFYKTGFNFICLADPDNVSVFNAGLFSGMMIQSSVNLRGAVPALDIEPEKVILQNNERISMGFDEFNFFYLQLAFFIRVVETTFNDAREPLLKATTIDNVLAIPAPDYNEAVKSIPRTFIPKQTIWERRDNYMNNTRVAQWMNKWFGDGYINEPDSEEEQI
jgi:hypothetical protein